MPADMSPKFAFFLALFPETSEMQMTRCKCSRSALWKWNWGHHMLWCDTQTVGIVSTFLPMMRKKYRSADVGRCSFVILSSLDGDFYLDPHQSSLLDSNSINNRLLWPFLSPHSQSFSRTRRDTNRFFGESIQRLCFVGSSLLNTVGKLNCGRDEDLLVLLVSSFWDGLPTLFVWFGCSPWSLSKRNPHKTNIVWPFKPSATK